MDLVAGRAVSQNAELLRLLRAAGPDGVTPLDALRAVGTMRLAARVLELRARGHDIETVVTGNHATYVLHERPAVYAGSQQGIGI